MDSSSTQRHQDHKLVPKQCETFFKYLSSQRTPSSFSSCSSFSPSSSSFGSLYFADDTLLSPTTPHRFSGVPFSWEHLPGIPKKQSSKKKQESSFKLLPLPPPTTRIHSCKKLNHDDETRIRKKNSVQSNSQRDPFFDAMVKCSKDDHEEGKSINLWNDAKVSRSFSDRFGFINLNASCKRTSAVSESIVYISSSKRST
ncbi:hypothetical protein TanjilG_02556 [Lupinus angustifolius]|uniref:Uncharacterized protein n=1 Tax=Lupinus angustifolius TaxID=3871 RepID=A0A1J7GEJ2_LUPAN|nr:PREDICTED: uncharacterized protein LOC109325041 [Lupinus angustifolius]OIV98846.1 hypothetical protein TanjilG_02556 [Lupinus angustifolius]